jgi:hypothetical protein
MWRITGDDIYREWGWEMFEAFVKHTIVENGGGFTSVGDVMQVPPPKRDNMESFWLVSRHSSISPIYLLLLCWIWDKCANTIQQAETLKYFYLLFGSNELLPLDQIVLNTEAHVFPRFDPSKKRFSTGWKRIPRDKDGNLAPVDKKEEEKAHKASAVHA